MEKELYCGVDLHSNNGVYHIVDADGRSVWQRRVRNVPELALKALSPFGPRLHTVAVESTYNWYWLVDTLQAAGYHVVLANPSAMEQYRGLKHTSDESDAAFMAELLRLGILPTGWICPPADRAWRDLLRRRMKMVEMRTRLILSLESMVTRQTAITVKSDQLQLMLPEEVVELLEHPALFAIAKAQLYLLKAHNRAIASLEKQALEHCKPCPEYKLLQTAPGIGLILAMVMMMEIGTIGRFPSPGDFSSYCRAVSSERTSNNKRKGTNNTRNGNKYLSWAFTEAANHAIRCCVPARNWYQRKTANKLPVVGRKALAAKWSKAVWYMLKNNEPFKLDLVFGEDSGRNG